MSTSGFLANDEVGDKLQHWLGEVFGAKARLNSVQRLAGGAVQDNWSLDVAFVGGEHAGEHALVLRADAPSTIAASLSRSDEFAVLRAVHHAGVCVPEPLALCADTSIVGRPFYLMRRIQGHAGGHRLVKQCDAQGGLDGEALVHRLGAELARVHQLRPPLAELHCLPLAAAAPAHQRIATYRNYLDALPQPRPVLEWALHWLQSRAPMTAQRVLCHGDYRTGNFMVEDGVGLSGILDWEFAAWSDAHEDIGWFCARCWRFGREEREAGGVGSRQSFYRGYQSVSGVEPNAELVAWWEVMAAVRWAIIALQQGNRHLSGEQPSLELALTARMVPDMELDALNEVERIIGARS